jgi:hypothetical protein
MRAVGIILAGGNSYRMRELSNKRAIAAMPIAGSYRSVDFALSSMSNSHIQKVAVLTQYNSRSLNEHLSSSKWWDFGRKQGGLFVFPPMQTPDNSFWYRGTADSIYQNLYSQLTDDKSIWESIGSFFSSLISGEDDDENSGLSEQIEEIYKEAKADADKVTATGTITFAFKGGSWTITDMDEELFLAFYGISNLVDQ